jgi:Fe-S cluster biogenesis protein NfuA
MAQDAAFLKRIQRIGEIVEQLEQAADPNARSIGRELLECLMVLHGAALERILEFASGSGEAGQALIQKCGSDELVSSVLLLYGLHPQSLNTRVTLALEKSRPFLESHSATAELLAVRDDGAVTVRLHTKSNGCGSAAVKPTLEAALQEAAPDASAIVVEEIGATLTGIGFVPIAELQNIKIASAQGTAD